MAFSNKRYRTSVNIQASHTPTVGHRGRQTTRVVSVKSSSPNQHKNIFARPSKRSFSYGAKPKKTTTKRSQVERSYKVVKPIPPTAVTNTPPPEVPTPTVVEEQSYTWVYTPSPPPPVPPKGPVEHIASASTKDELVIDSLDNIASFMKKTSVSNLRPELLGSLDWIPGKNNLGGLTSIDKLVDIRWSARQLLIENVEETIKVLRDENEAGGFDDLMASYEEYDERYQTLIDDAYSVISVLETAKNSLDIKDNEAVLAPVMVRLLDEKVPRATSTDADLSIRSLFVNSLGFSEEGYDKFSNSKILNQIISDLRFAVQRHSPLLIGEDNFDRQDDLDSLRIDREIVPRHRGYKLRPSHLRSPKFNPKAYSKYSSFLASLPVDDEDRIKVLISLLSRELTVSAGLGLMTNEALGDRFGAPDPNSIERALGRPRNNILVDVSGDGSLADYVLINETNKTVTSRSRRTGRKYQRNISGTDDRTILPFETRVFVDRRGRRAVPGSVAMVDNIIRYGNMFNTDPYATFARGFKDVTDDVVDYIEKLLNLEDEEYKLQPQTIFSTSILGLKNTIDGLTSSNHKNEEQATLAAILNLCRTDQELRHLTFRYLLELRDVADELASDTAETLEESRAIEDKIENLESQIDDYLRASLPIDPYTGMPILDDVYGNWQSAELLKKEIQVLEDISDNLAVDADDARDILLSSKNPLSHIAMKIAKKVYDLAEDFPAGTVPTDTRDIIKIGREAIYSNLMSAVHDITMSKSAVAVIITIVHAMEETAAELAARNNGDGTYLTDKRVTRYNGWNENSFFMIIFEVFVLLFSRYVESKLYRANDTLYVLYDSDKNLQLKEAIDTIIETALVDSTVATALLADDVADDGISNEAIAEGTYSQSAALQDLSGDSASSAFADLQTFMTELEQETKFIHQMNSILEALAETLSISADQLEDFFNVAGDSTGIGQRLKDLNDHPLGTKFLESLSSQQLLLLNALRRKAIPRENDSSYLPADQTISTQEIGALRALLAEPKMGGRTGDNIRILPVGIPAGLLKTLRNPSYTIGTKESTELQEHENVIEINVYKRDLEYEDVIFKPKKYLYDISLFMLPDTFKNVEVTDSTGASKTVSLEEVYSNADYSHFTALKNSDDEASATRTANDVIESGLYEFLGTGSGERLLTNHLSDRLLKLYYGLLFGLEIDERTFMYDDAWLDIFVDDDAKRLLQLGEANATTTWWVRNGSVPISNLILNTTIEGETLSKVVTAEDARPWMKERTFPNPHQAWRFWWQTESTRRFEAGNREPDTRHHHHGRKPMYGTYAHMHTHTGARKASASTNSVQMPKYHSASNSYRIPPLLNATDLTSFRTLTSSTLFNSHGRLLKFMAPKLFDRVFMVPVDPDDFEIDVDATSENFGGDEFLNKDFFSEISEDAKSSDGRTVKRLKARRKGENYSSFNDFFVTISTPTLGST